MVRTEDFPPMEDIRAGVLEAIRHPIGCPSLDEIVKPGDTVAFICNDPTRVANSYDFMPVLVDEMNRLGVKDEDMKIVFALGTHRAMSHEEMVEGVGENVASRLKMFNSICTNDDDFEYFGTTSRRHPRAHSQGALQRRPRDPHGHDRAPLLLGLRRRPQGDSAGCAAMETVRVNHSFMLDENAALGRTTGNPCYEDQMEGVALFAKGRSLFLFNAILNAKHQFLRMFAGDYIAAHKEACKFVDEVYGCVIPKLADLVIVSCGGYPKDINVYQMQKTMENASCAVRKDGVVISLPTARKARAPRCSKRPSGA